MEYILLLVGFILLIKGADFFVEGSSSLAGILKVPSVIIGLTIVAMGTSAPEASVSINAALAGSNDIAISNVVGSNIFNGLVVVGICAFLHSFMPHGEILKRDMPLNILVTVVLCLMFLDGSLSRIEGAVLLLGMIVYLGFMIYSARKNREEGEPGKILSLPRSLLYIAGGLAAVIFGGDLVVDKACIIATNFGVSQNFIGLTIIAIGIITSGACDVHRCNQKGRQRSCTGQCDRIKYFQYSFYPWVCQQQFHHLMLLGESLTDCIILLISTVILFVLGKDKKDNVKMGRRGLRTVVYCIHSISADQVKIAQIWER